MTRRNKNRRPGLRARVHAFLEKDIWEWDTAGTGRLRAFAITQLRIYFIIARGFVRERLNLRAAALTYITIFSLIPVLAVSFAVFNAFGGLKQVQDKLLPELLDMLTVGSGDQVRGKIEEFIANIHGGAIGAAGTFLLFFSVVSLLGGMEKAFNDIWGVRRDRSFFQRFTIYWTMVTVTPVLLAFALLLPEYFERIHALTWLLEKTHLTGAFFGVLLPFVLTWFAFTLTYAFMPNTAVRPLPALVGGFTGAFLWKAAIWGFKVYAVGAVKYSQIYGSLAVIPIFLLWIYLNWVLVLFGAQVCFATQNVATYRNERRALDAPQALRELLALRIMVAASRAFLDGKHAPVPWELARDFNAPVRLVNDVVHQLAEADLLLEVGDEPGLIPARDPDSVSPADVLDTLRQWGEIRIRLKGDRATRRLSQLLEEAEQAGRTAWDGASFAALARDGAGGGDGGDDAIPETGHAKQGDT